MKGYNNGRNKANRVKRVIVPVHVSTEFPALIEWLATATMEDCP